MTVRPTLILASASPARLRTLRAAGLDPQVMVSGVDESNVEAAGAATLCATLARIKAEAVAARLRRHDSHPGPSHSTAPVLVLGCDSVLELDGEILGKPADEIEAIKRWQRMRGTTGVLHTGHCLVEVGSDRLAEEVASATIHFADISDDEIAAYVATGEPLQVAGAFAIDGMGGWFIDAISGDPGTVIGLSLPLLRRLLADLGMAVPALWTARLAS